ncbi:hypothetical protein, partial [Cnuella takakiae]|uniref:hypothetical protein n=1 Tax=Cnuella takakiae TaxID=1302690 RepID=UPI000979F74B
SPQGSNLNNRRCNRRMPANDAPSMTNPVGVESFASMLFNPYGVGCGYLLLVFFTAGCSGGY